MDAEMTSMEKFGVYEWVDKADVPPGVRVVGSRWAHALVIAYSIPSVLAIVLIPLSLRAYVVKQIQNFKNRCIQFCMQFCLAVCY